MRGRSATYSRCPFDYETLRAYACFIIMISTHARQRAESLFDREKRRDGGIADAMKEELARHEATLGNMHRLKALRLSQATKNTRMRKKQPAKT
jgi:hypothetical protein